MSVTADHTSERHTPMSEPESLARMADIASRSVALTARAQAILDQLAELTRDARLAFIDYENAMEAAPVTFGDEILDTMSVPSGRLQRVFIEIERCADYGLNGDLPYGDLPEWFVARAHR